MWAIPFNSRSILLLEVLQEQGKPFKSKPYRFRVFNGSFAMLETDWSCFINPWSWKLEFVIGQHRVVQVCKYSFDRKSCWLET
jgi:hypothetical protein